VKFDSTRRVAAVDAIKRIPGSQGEQTVEVFRHGSLEISVYHPMGADLQTPHTRDEAYVVMRGHGTYVSDAGRQHCEVGDLLFAPAGVEHRFDDITDDFFVWVIFYGPEGGEKAGPGAGA
jgi:mannose-6-phosphate isomerase-like protein (cupin superfamily)